ncbi:MAG: hypothetical protein KatS3mg085_043 [Candidatus Dojkabacteria bacterium]|nr:MAG: hypothetical protein KatS3mg085_043 [Candidatus Dojkabacteria bacterium]
MLNKITIFFIAITLLVILTALLLYKSMYLREYSEEIRDAISENIQANNLPCGLDLINFEKYDPRKKNYQSSVVGDIFANGSLYAVKVLPSNEISASSYDTLCISVKQTDIWKDIFYIEYDLEIWQDVPIISVEDLNLDNENEILILNRLLDMGTSKSFYIFSLINGKLLRLENDVKLFNPVFDPSTERLISSKKIRASDFLIQEYIYTDEYKLELVNEYVESVTAPGVIEKIPINEYYLSL